MNQTNKTYPSLSDIYTHINSAIEESSSALAEYREGHLEIVHRKVIEARNRLSIAESMLAYELFIQGESV